MRHRWRPDVSPMINRIGDTPLTTLGASHEDSELSSYSRSIRTPLTFFWGAHWLRKWGARLRKWGAQNSCSIWPDALIEYMHTKTGLDKKDVKAELELTEMYVKNSALIRCWKRKILRSPWRNDFFSTLGGFRLSSSGWVGSMGGLGMGGCINTQ